MFSLRNIQIYNNGTIKCKINNVTFFTGFIYNIYVYICIYAASYFYIKSIFKNKKRKYFFCSNQIACEIKKKKNGQILLFVLKQWNSEEILFYVVFLK